MTSAVAAVDLDATSGRVMLGHVGHNELSVQPVSRFPNGSITAADGASIDLAVLLDAAADLTAPVPLFDANDERFLAPGDLPARIAGWLTERGMPVPQSHAEFVRSIIESLSDAFARAVSTASELSGKAVAAIHIVGGGSQNELLCQLTADRSGIPVIAGPVEATAIGNVLVQARAQGLIAGDLESLRALVARSIPLRRFEPRSKQDGR
jgi:rhamnulokinase